MTDKIENLVWGAFAVAAVSLAINFAKDVAPIMGNQFQQSKQEATQP